MATFSNFNLQDALAGQLVGFQNGSDTNDLSLTGKLQEPGPLYKLVIGGFTLKVNSSGTVVESRPSGFHVGETLNMVTATMDPSLDYGTSYPTRHEQTGRVTNVNVTQMEPRDEFAVAALKILMSKLENPEMADDATILSYTQSAYRWAKGMMDSAIQARISDKQNEEETPSTQEKDKVEVDTSSLSTTLEKVLYNIQVTLENTKIQNKEVYEKGLPIINAIKTVGGVEQTVPVITKLDPASEINEVKKVTQLPNITIGQMPAVTISGTPNVNVVNTVSTDAPSTVSVDNFPSTIAVTGTVSVDNFPTSE